MYVLLGAPLVPPPRCSSTSAASRVLILFAIMLTQSKSAPGPARLPDAGDPGRDRGRRSSRSSSRSPSPPPTGARSTARLETATDTLARLLFRDYVLPFEIVSVLLLAAVIGGVFLAKREEGGPP